MQAFYTRAGAQWGEHTNMEDLFALGVGIGRVKLLLPRNMWRMLPGGMPYYSVNVLAPVTIPEEAAIRDEERAGAEPGTRPQDAAG